MIGQTIDLHRVRLVEGTETADDEGVASGGLVSHVLQNGIIQNTHAEFGEADGHVQLAEIRLRRFDCRGRSGLGTGVGNSPHVLGVPDKPLGMRTPGIPGPRAPHGGKARAVRDVEACAQLMAELVRGEVGCRAEAGQTVVGDTAAPHQLAHGLRVMAVAERRDAVGNHGAQKGFGERVRQLVAARGREVAVERVHHDIHDAARHLIRRERVREFRVHQRKAGTVQRGGEPTLDAGLFIGQNSGVARLAACGGDRQNNSDRKNGGRRGCALPVFPDIVFRSSGAQSDGLRGVDDAAAADGQNEVRAEVKRLTDRAACEAQTGIGVYAAEFLVCEPRSLKTLRQTLQKTAAHDAAAAVQNKHTAAAERTDLIGQMIFRIRAEDHFCRAVKRKAVHDAFLRILDSRCITGLTFFHFVFIIKSHQNFIKYQKKC